MERLIDVDKSVIVACDMKFGQLKAIVEATHDIDKISGYKIGMSMITKLDRVADVIRETAPHKLTILDYQKGGNDIPKMGGVYADLASISKFDAAILFPFAGPVVLSEWVDYLRKKGVIPIIGGWMTHPQFLLEGDNGYFPKASALRIYKDAASKGVSNFVVPGNKPEAITEILGTLKSVGITTDNAVFYSPGLISQGGEIAEITKMFGKGWHAIVGSGIYKAPNMRTAAERITSEL